MATMMPFEHESSSRSRKFYVFLVLVCLQAVAALFIIYSTLRAGNSQYRINSFFQNCNVPTRASLAPQVNQSYAPANLYLYPAPHIDLETIVNSTVKKPYFAICASVKDQNTDIREWLYYHYWLGVEKFYIYDHNSSRPVFLDIQDWVRVGVVEYSMFAGHHKLKPKLLFNNTGQGYAYNDCLTRARNRHQWLGFIDVDEFLVLNTPTGNRDIETFLKDYEQYGGLSVNWRIFGSSGHKAKPKQSTMEAYTACLPDPHSIQVKTLVNVPNTAKIGTNPHHFEYIKGKFTVNEMFEECKGVKGFCENVSLTKIMLNHYVTKSLEEYQVKMSRGGGSGSIKKMTYFQHIDNLATMTCPTGPKIWQQCCAAASAQLYQDTAITGEKHM